MEDVFEFTVAVDPVVPVFYAAPEAQAVAEASAEGDSFVLPDAAGVPEGVELENFEAGGLFFDLTGTATDAAVLEFLDAWGGAEAFAEFYYGFYAQATGAPAPTAVHFNTMEDGTLAWYAGAA